MRHVRDPVRLPPELKIPKQGRTLCRSTRTCEVAGVVSRQPRHAFTSVRPCGDSLHGPHMSGQAAGMPLLWFGNVMSDAGVGVDKVKKKKKGGRGKEAPKER